MIKEYNLILFSVTVRTADDNYSMEKILRERPEDNSRILKQEVSSDKHETCYSLMKGLVKVAHIAGYFKDPNTFHISQVANLSKDKKSGFRYLYQVFSAMQEDLKENGVKKMTTTSIAPIAPIAVERYGFRDLNPIGYKKINSAWRRHIPGIAVSLEKML